MPTWKSTLFSLFCNTLINCNSGDASKSPKKWKPYGKVEDVGSRIRPGTTKHDKTLSERTDQGAYDEH